MFKYNIAICKRSRCWQVDPIRFINYSSSGRPRSQIVSLLDIAFNVSNFADFWWKGKFVKVLGRRRCPDYLVYVSSVYLELRFERIQY